MHFSPLLVKDASLESGRSQDTSSQDYNRNVRPLRPFHRQDFTLLPFGYLIFSCGIFTVFKGVYYLSFNQNNGF